MENSMKKCNLTGRLTLPTDVDMVSETIRLKNLLGADALRDCDGTDMPGELLSQDAKSTPPTIPPEKTTPGRKQIRKKSSRNT